MKEDYVENLYLSISDDDEDFEKSDNEDNAKSEEDVGDDNTRISNDESNFLMEDTFRDETDNKEEIKIQIHENTSEDHWKPEERAPEYEKAKKGLRRFENMKKCAM